MKDRERKQVVIVGSPQIVVMPDWSLEVYVLGQYTEIDEDDDGNRVPINFILPILISEGHDGMLKHTAIPGIGSTEEAIYYGDFYTSIPGIPRWVLSDS